jgi:hypothetical protein
MMIDLFEIASAGAFEPIIQGEEDGIEYLLCPCGNDGYLCFLRKGDKFFQYASYGFSPDWQHNVPDAIYAKDIVMAGLKSDLEKHDIEDLAMNGSKDAPKKDEQ